MRSIVNEACNGLIVGGGPTGLSTALAFGEGCVVVEKEGKVGGLCRSVTRDGAVFDIGGHSFHTPHVAVRDLVLSLFKDEGLFLQKRDARVRWRSQLIPYPFQRHFDQIEDATVVRECQEGLDRCGDDPGAAENFKEYIIKKFGAGIAQHFMLPYNTKLWARDVSSISCEWTSERVAAAKGQSERFKTSGDQRKPLQADTRVGYPPRGGFEEICRALASRAPDVRTGREVVKICTKTRTAWLQNGEPLEWRFLVSTAPLPRLLRLIVDAPLELQGLAETLQYMSLRVELITVEGPPRTPVQRVYVHDRDIPPHKIAFNHNSSDFLRGLPRHAIMAETSLSEDKQVDVAAIAPKTVEMLCDLGLLSSPKDVLSVGSLNVRYGYPVYTKDRPEKVAAIKEWLEQQDIYSAGRFGDWDYVNSDKCIARGLALGELLQERYGSRAGRETESSARTAKRRTIVA